MKITLKYGATGEELAKILDTSSSQDETIKRILKLINIISLEASIKGFKKKVGDMSDEQPDDMVCPNCCSEDITMCGDPEFNDLWGCWTCDTDFNSWIERQEFEKRRKDVEKESSN